MSANHSIHHHTSSAQCSVCLAVSNLSVVGVFFGKATVGGLMGLTLFVLIVVVEQKLVVNMLRPSITDKSMSESSAA